MSNFVPATKTQQAEMLAAIGVSSMEELFAQVPAEILLCSPLDLSQEGQAFGPGQTGMDELSQMAGLAALAAQNKTFSTVLRGGGAYRHFIPAAVANVVSQDKFVTAYTPYQPEISQGILQSIFEYQTSVCELTGLAASNASLYDGASAAAEAVAMCASRGEVVLVSEGVHPAWRETMKTYARGNGVRLETLPLENGQTVPAALEARLNASKVAAVFVQNPNAFGQIEDVSALAAASKAANARFIYGFNPIAAALLPSPGEVMADVAVAEGQPLGLPLGFGGPYLGMIACAAPLLRKLPGRIAGQTADAAGRRAFVLTLQAREQHIRREKAQSNVCTNQALCALAASAYLTAMGPKGLTDVANSCLSKAHYLAEQLAKLPGVSLPFQGEFFHEFVTVSPARQEILNALAENSILGGLPLGENRLLWCVTEMAAKTELDETVRIVKAVLEAEGGGVCN